MAQYIDLTQIVRDWAWREYDKTATKSQRNLKEKEERKGSKYLHLQIDWSDVKFHDETMWPRLAEDRFDEEGRGRTVVQNGGGHGTLAADTGTTHTNVLFQTTFTNNTGDSQEYTLKTEKSTRSTCMTEIETSFTKGMDLSVKLCTPGEILEANAGYHREMSLTNVEGETLEEELNWGVESQIRVRPEHVAEAELVVKEKKYSGEFQIKSKIRGYVYVTFTNIKDNNSLVKAMGHDVSDIVQSYLDMERRKGKTVDFVEIQDSLIIIYTKGKCQFRYGVKQEVKVQERPLNNKY